VHAVTFQSPDTAVLCVEEALPRTCSALQPYLHQETVTLRTELRTVEISFIKLQPYLHQETVTLRTELRTVEISFIKGITATLSNPRCTSETPTTPK
jgi:short-subunit dehydrogenase involved in D-alanine esterification of teichoic acids